MKELRKQRAFAVQSSPQYLFLHVAFVEMLLAEGAIRERSKVHRDFQADFERYLQRMLERDKTRTGAANKPDARPFDDLHTAIPTPPAPSPLPHESPAESPAPESHSPTTKKTADPFEMSLCLESRR